MTKKDAPHVDDAALLGPTQVRELAERLEVRPTKQWGQNFVVDANTVRKIVRVAGVGPHDVVVEVGPGLGSLTLALLPVVKHVTAVEVDPRLAGALEETVRSLQPENADKLRLVAADALTITKLPGPDPTALSPTCPTTSRSPSCSPSSSTSRRSSASSSWCSSRSPSGSRPSRAARSTASRASRPRGTPMSSWPGGSGATSSGPRRTSTRAW